MGSEGEKGTAAGMSAKPEFRPACGLALVPEPFFEPGLMGPTGPGSSDDFFSPEGKTFYDMANSLFSMFAQLENSCNLPRSKVQNSGGVSLYLNAHRRYKECLAMQQRHSFLSLDASAGP